jgi:hypothetical protein
VDDLFYYKDKFYHCIRCRYKCGEQKEWRCEENKIYWEAEAKEITDIKGVK